MNEIHSHEWRLGTFETERMAFFDRFADILEDTDLEALAREMFLLVVVEAVNNAIEHGLRDNQAGFATIQAYLGRGAVLVSVSDSGPGYCPIYCDLKSSTGPRGRGLALMRLNTDAIFFNQQGNEVVLIKGGYAMQLQTGNVQARVTTLPGGLVVVTDLKFVDGKINISQGIAELMEGLESIPERMVFIDMAHVRLVSSMGWGAIFASSESADVKGIILFNSNEAICKTADQMGIYDRGGIYAKIKVIGVGDNASRIIGNLILGQTGAVGFDFLSDKSS